MSNHELIAACESRADLYTMLARAFRVEVDEDFLAELKAARYPQNTGNDQVDEGYRRLHGFLAGTTESTLNTLAVDYARAFLGSGALDAEAAYPFESVYTSPKGLVMQDSRDEVLAVYRSEGVDKNVRWKEPEDHLAPELEFMAILCQRTAEALQKGDESRAVALLETQRAFLNDHLLIWTPRFCELVPRYARTEFYKAFAQLLLAFLREDQALLDELLDDAEESED